MLKTNRSTRAIVNILLSVYLVSSVESKIRIDPTIQKSLQDFGFVNILITLNKGTSTVLSQFSNTIFNSRSEKLNMVVSSLKQHSDLSQKDIILYLSLSSKSNELLNVESYWISNQIYVAKADKPTIDTLTTFQEIAVIKQVKGIPRDKLFPVFKSSSDEVQRDGPTKQTASWGIEKVRADLVWELGINGSNVRVATIDTGARGTHEALRNNFYGKYGWYEPKGNNSLFPTDEYGHGTHTTGTVAGRLGIGVAPGSQWMACKICMTGMPECYLPDLLACGQFFMCPTEPDGISNPDCSSAPHVINNSWGHIPEDGDEWSFDLVIEAWLSVGIVPVFSIGNGYQCWQTIYPGDKENVIGVGGTTMDDRVPVGSSRGPTMDGRVKPDITAPGIYIKWSSFSSDTDYATMHGTSMASPHVAGVVALLLSYKIDLSVDQVKHYLFDGASLDYKLTGDNCNNVVESRTPNNAFGHGILDAYKSIQLLRADYPDLDNSRVIPNTANVRI